MKCNRYAIYGWKTKKGMNKPPKVLGSFGNLATMEGMSDKPIPLMSHAEICNGEIESNVHIEYMGSYEGEALFQDAGIEAEFKCKKCGWNYAGSNGLPVYVDDLNKFLTEVISKL